MKWHIPALFLIFITGCSKNKCNDDTRDFYQNVYHSTILLKVQDKDGNNLLNKYNRIYNESDIKIFNTDNDSLFFYFNPPGSQSPKILIEGLINNQDVNYQDEISKRIFIDFKSDRDTIDYFFTIRKGECGPLLNSIKVNFNNKELEGESHSFGFNGVVVK